MKDIKSLIIGFLLATCMFLMMGLWGDNSEIGRYQIDGNNIVDTSNGKLYRRTGVGETARWLINVPADAFYGKLSK